MGIYQEAPPIAQWIIDMIEAISDPIQRRRKVQELIEQGIVDKNNPRIAGYLK
jgi:hypothetical protein